MKKVLPILSGIFIALLTFQAKSSLAANANPNTSFDPSGQWSIHFEDRCRGVSQAGTTATPTASDKPFQCSSYLEKDKPPRQAELQVSFDPKTNSVTLTGGPSQFPRTIALDQDRTGVSNVKLFPKTEVQSKQCNLDTYFLEGVRFKDSNTLEYRYITVNEFVPHSDAPKGCEPYLKDLKKAVQRRTATGFLLAMRDTNAIQVKSMQDMSSLDLVSSFSGSRLTG